MLPIELSSLGVPHANFSNGRLRMGAISGWGGGFSLGLERRKDGDDSEE